MIESRTILPIPTRNINRFKLYRGDGKLFSPNIRERIVQYLKINNRLDGLFFLN